MSQQVWAREAALTLGNSAVSIGLCGPGGAGVIPASGTIDKLTIILDAVVAASATKVFTLTVNGTPTALTGTIVATQSGIVCTGGPISVTVGDLVSIEYTKTGTPGSSTTIQISWVFASTTTGQSIYMGSGITINTTTPRWCGAFAIGDAGVTTAASVVTSVAAAAGTITAMYVSVPASAGSTGSYTFTLYKNGVIQDGTSGTPNTKVTIVNSTSRVDGSSSFSLSVAAADQFYIEIVSVSTPSTKTCSIGLQFTATNAGESQFCWPLPSFPSANGGVNNFNGPHPGGTIPSWSTEATRGATVAAKFKLSGMQMWAVTAPGATKSRTFENRKNSGSGSMSLTISGTSTTGSDLTHSDNYAALDFICFYESATANTPTASTGSVGFIQTVQQGNPPGKSQQGNKKNGGGGVNIFTPGSTQMLFTNPGVSSDAN